MADLHIRREHSLGLAAARDIAKNWQQQVQDEFSMECEYEEGATADTVAFSRSGVKGVLTVATDHFDLDAKLGFLLGAFKGRIEAEIVKNLDQLLAEGAAKKPSEKKAENKKG